MSKFLTRMPFSLVGAFGFLGVISSFAEFTDLLKEWLVAWQWMVNLLWAWFPVDLGWFKHYLTMGYITVGMHYRALVRYPKHERIPLSPYKIIFMIILWPYIWGHELLAAIAAFTKNPEKVFEESDKKSFTLSDLYAAREDSVVYWESLFYAGLILALSYISFSKA